MSSNIELAKKCEYCQGIFTAKTTITRYCSHKCNQRHYKHLRRDEKLKKVFEPLIPKSEQVLLSKDFLSIPEAAQLAGVSERTIFRMISRKLITPVRRGRNVTIRVNDLLKQKSYENLY